MVHLGKVVSGKVVAPFVALALGAAELIVLGTRSGSTVPLSVVVAAEAEPKDEEVIEATKRYNRVS